VPHNGRGVAFEQRQRRKDRSIATAPGNDDLGAGGKRQLDRLDPHHADDVCRGGDIGLTQRR